MTFKMFFERLTNPFPPVDSSAPPKSLLRFLSYYSKGFGKALVTISILEALSAICEISIFAFMGQLVDWLSSHDKETFLQEEYPALLFYSAIVLIAMPVLKFLYTSFHLRTVQGNFPMAIRWRTHRYLLGQSMTFYQDEFAGRVATKVMQTSLSARETVVKFFAIGVYISVYFLSMFYVLFSLNVWLMLPLLCWMISYVFIQMHFTPQIRDVSQAQASARSTMTGRIVDAYTNISTVKLFAHTEREADYAKSSMNDFLKTVYDQMRVISYLLVSVGMINYLLVFATSALSIYLWLNDMVQTGAIAVAIALALRILGMAQWIMFEISAMFENIGTVTDGMNMLSKPQTVTDKPNAPKLDIKEGKIDFNNVQFLYGKTKDIEDEEHEKTRAIFDSLNLNINAGEKIGLVGRSGAGKSTLVNLLLRFYDVQNGTISIDGQNISDVKQDSIRENIAMVTQDTALLHRSVRENILYGRPDATEEELLTAIKQAKADEFIDQLTDPNGNVGLDAQVGERGVKLSGGQRQRVAIARVLLKNAPILILDEATSALDSEVEAAIQESLDELMQGKTVIAIAHRLSTIAALDRLVVMDEGKIIEQGSHQDLLDKKGVYAKLWTHQTGGFLGQE